MIPVAIFTQAEDFAALYAARGWCDSRDISVGRHERGRPAGLLLGSFDIQKWHNLTQAHIAALDGKLVGGRSGPVTVFLTRRAAARLKLPEAAA
jgi:hypothetical protein